MKKALFLSLILVLALATTGLAGPAPISPRLNYMGYCSQYSDGTVLADTLICVFNPNSVPVTVTVHVYNKMGVLLAEDMQLHDGTLITEIPKMGMGWCTIGQLVRDWRNAQVPPVALGLEPMKYPFVIEFKPTMAVTPNRGVVAEVKQILYNSAVDPEDCWDPTKIKCWAETALNKGKGKYGGGVGFSK